jgi:Helicase associated domain
MAKSGQLPAERKDKLDAAGFNFKSQSRPDETWMENFELLKAFKREKGHFSVPKRDAQLGNWISMQRHRLKQEGRLSERMRERRALLIKIGFLKDLTEPNRVSATNSVEHAGTESPGVVDDANSPRNGAAGVAPGINGTDAAGVAPALSPGETTSRQQCQNLQKLNRAENSKLMDRHSKQAHLGSASRIEASVLAARTPPNPSKAMSYEREREKNKSARTVEESLVDTSVPAAGHALNAFESSSHIGGATAGTGMGIDTVSRDLLGVTFGNVLELMTSAKTMI